jgi:oxygen-independent coproporphyrinogen-3 oxidase
MKHKIGVYVHFPYCEKKCPYCDFNSHTTEKIDHNAFLKAYKEDLDFYIAKLTQEKPRILESIFFGGGTPSLMKPFVVGEIVEYIKEKCGEFGIEIAKKLEISLEANPSSFEVKKFIDFKNAGINRVSIGVQAFNEEDLKALGRLHDTKQAINAINHAKEIFERFSFDLIYARQNQTLQNWENELEFALKEFTPSHISLYTLTIEKGTQFFKLHKEGKLTIPENQDDFYDLTNSICKNYALERYEVSNYSKPQNECRHNVLYWVGAEYIGIGPGAHGRIDGENGRIATMNFNMPAKYLDSIQAKHNANQTFELINGENLAFERITMGLRTKNGFNFDGIAKYINFKNVEILCDEGILEKEVI